MADTIPSEGFAIAIHALKRDRRIQQITVKVTKPTPPIPNFSGTVAVEITRTQ